MPKHLKPIRWIDENTVAIPLTQGQETIIDAADLLQVGRFNWCASKWQNGKFYAYHKIRKYDGTGTNIAMHRYLLGADKSVNVDHKDGDSLNNRRSNIRLAPGGGNQQNRKKLSHRSLPKGVHVNRKKYRARIYANGKKINLGTFLTPEAAHKAYCDAAVKYFGEFARFE